MGKVEELEQAILARANRLAEQYRQQGEDTRSDVLRKAAAQLQQREQHEILVGRLLAERSYQRRVQAGEFNLQAHLDHLKWRLLQEVYDRLNAALHDLPKNEDRYLKILQTFLAEGVVEFDVDDLVVQVNKRDHARLAAVWREFTAAASNKQIMLDDAHLDCIGGLVLRTADNRFRLDNTFEGRMRRMHNELDQTIREVLLPPTADEPASADAIP